MKKLFTGALVLNLLVEGFAAVTLISSPQSAFLTLPAEAAVWPRIYGFAALAMGSTIFWIWPHRDNLKVVSTVLGILCTFHIGIAVGLALSAGQGASAITHTVLSSLFVVLYIQRSKWCTDA